MALYLRWDGVKALIDMIKADFKKKSNEGHKHKTEDITSGEFPTERLANESVTIEKFSEPLQRNNQYPNWRTTVTFEGGIGWRRIATMPAYTGTTLANIEDSCVFSISAWASHTTSLCFVVSCSMTTQTNPSIVQLNNNAYEYAKLHISKVRIVYDSTKSNMPFYMDVYFDKSSNMTANIAVANGSRWELVSDYISDVAGDIDTVGDEKRFTIRSEAEIPDGYEAYEFEFVHSGIKSQYINGIDFDKKIKELEEGIEDVASGEHTHTVSEITDFPTAMPASDVSDWAKRPKKPTYTAEEVGAAEAGHTHKLTDITEVDTTPTSGSNNPVTSDGVATELKKKFGIVNRALDATINLNDLIETGIYEAASNSICTTANNYPIQEIGALEVLAPNGWQDVYQRYTSMVNSYVYVRRRQTLFTTPVTYQWSKWKRVLDSSMVDTTPISGSSNLVESGGVCAELDKKFDKSGGTITNDKFGLFILKRLSEWQASIGFINTKGNLGYIGIVDVDGDVIHTYGADTSKQYPMLDSNNYKRIIGNNYITSEALSVQLAKKLDNIQASSTPYDTGREWIDGQAIYRVDFSVIIPYGSAIWNRGFLYMWEIVECYQHSDPTFSTIINCNAVQTLAIYDEANNTYKGDGWNATTLLPMNSMMWKLQTDGFMEGDGYGLMINGFYEYVREATAASFIEVL